MLSSKNPFMCAGINTSWYSRSTVNNSSMIKMQSAARMTFHGRSILADAGVFRSLTNSQITIITSTKL